MAFRMLRDTYWQLDAFYDLFYEEKHYFIDNNLYLKYLAKCF